MVERTPILDTVCHVLLLVGVAAVCLPLYMAFVTGSLTLAEVQKIPLPWTPGSHLLENLETAWNSTDFGRSLLNSFIVATGITIGKVVVSFLAAFAVTYFRFRFRMLAFWLIFASMMVPVEVRIVPTYDSVANVALPLQWLIDLVDLPGLLSRLTGYELEMQIEWSMINTYPGLILPLIASATATFLFRQFFLTVPDDLLEAARLDGASAFRFMWTILLPLSRANLAALSIILFLWGWNQYLWPLLFTTSSDMATAMIALKNLVPNNSDMEPAWNVTMSAALITMLPPVMVVLAMQRWFVRGLIDTDR